MKEETFAAQVVDWLTDQNFDVYQEVQFKRIGGIADIVAVRDDRIWIIEAKTSLNFRVLDQARDWRVHYRSVAVPAARDSTGRRLAFEIAERYLKVGIITVQYGNVYERIPAPLMREYHRSAKKLLKELTPLHKTFAKAGNNRGERLTPYKHSIIRVENYIRANPGATFRDIVADLRNLHYMTASSAYQGIRSALQNWESDKFFVDTSEKPFRVYLRDSKTGT